MLAQAFGLRELGQELPCRFSCDDLAHRYRCSLGCRRPRQPSAAQVYQPASAIESGLVPFSGNTSCLFPAYVRGEAYLANEQGTAAAAEFQKILDHTGIVGMCWTGALARLGLARAESLQSKTAHGADADAARVRALTAYKDFLTLWKDSDPEVLILKEAKTEYAKLQ